MLLSSMEHLTEMSFFFIQILSIMKAKQKIAQLKEQNELLTDQVLQLKFLPEIKEKEMEATKSLTVPEEYSPLFYEILQLKVPELKQTFDTVLRFAIFSQPDDYGNLSDKSAFVNINTFINTLN